MSQRASEAVRVFRSGSRNPYCNLAIEDWLYRTLPLSEDGHGERRLFLYRNDPCVVVGRHQNPWLECDLEGMQLQSVPLVRRQSGGGTVYHDSGNINWCFISSRKQYSQDENFAVVIDALASFGITAERSGRNDLLVEGRKISGSAFKVARERCFHHGTLLLDANLERLTAFLTPRTRSMQSKGIDSVRSRVANLTEFSEAVGYLPVCSALARVFAVRCSLDSAAAQPESQPEPEPEIHVIDSCDADSAEYAHSIREWDWLYGKTPDFTHAFEAGIVYQGAQVPVRAVLDVHRGRVRDLKLEATAGGQAAAGLQRFLETAEAAATRRLRDIRYRGPELAQGLAGTGSIGNTGLEAGLEMLAQRVLSEVE